MVEARRQRRSNVDKVLLDRPYHGVECPSPGPFDPICVWTHGERSERRGDADPSCPSPTDEGGSKQDMVGKICDHGWERQTPRPARSRVGATSTGGGRTGDRRVDLMDVGVYLAYADSNGLIGPPAGMAHFGRPLQLTFDADGDGRIDLFDWYALQTCYDRWTARCKRLFDSDASDLVDQADLDAFKLAADSAYGGPQTPQWRRKLMASRYGNPFMWTGQRFDATTGQYHFWARTYSPRLGRWMQRDPLEYLDSLNTYQGLYSNPGSLIDQLGLQVGPPVAPAVPGNSLPINYDPTVTTPDAPDVPYTGGDEFFYVWNNINQNFFGGVDLDIPQAPPTIITPEMENEIGIYILVLDLNNWTEYYRMLDDAEKTKANVGDVDSSGKFNGATIQNPPEMPIRFPNPNGLRLDLTDPRHRDIFDAYLYVLWRNGWTGFIVRPHHPHGHPRSRHHHKHIRPPLPDIEPDDPSLTPWERENEACLMR